MKNQKAPTKKISNPREDDDQYLEGLEQNINIRNVQQSKLFQKFKENNDTGRLKKQPSEMQIPSSSQFMRVDYNQIDYTEADEQYEEDYQNEGRNNDNHLKSTSEFENAADTSAKKGSKKKTVNYIDENDETDHKISSQKHKPQPKYYQGKIPKKNDFDNYSGGSDSEQYVDDPTPGPQPTNQHLTQSFYRDLPQNSNNQVMGHDLGRPTLPLNPNPEESFNYGYLQRRESTFGGGYPINSKQTADVANQSMMNQSVNLNINSASNYVPFYLHGNQSMMAQQAGFMPYQQPPYYGFVPGPDGFQQQPKDFNNNSNSKNANESDDVFLLRGKLNDVNQSLAREIETNKILEAKCQEYMNQLQKSAKNFEEFKQKMFEEKNAHREEIDLLESRIQELRDQLNGQGSTEEGYQEEIAELKKKLSQETSAKNRLAEELEVAKNKIDSTERLKREQETSSDKQAEELFRLKRQAEADREEICDLRDKEERQAAKIRSQDNEIESLRAKNVDMKKRLDDSEKEQNLMEKEIESLKSQVNNVTKQYQQLLNENQSLKNEFFESKQRLIETQQHEMDLKLTVEKSSRDLHQLQTLLDRTEQNYQDLVAVNNSLKRQLMDQNGGVVQSNQANRIPAYKMQQQQVSRGFEESPLPKDRENSRNFESYNQSSYSTRPNSNLRAQNSTSAFESKPTINRDQGRTDENPVNSRMKGREKINEAYNQRAKENLDNSVVGQRANTNKSRSDMLAWDDSASYVEPTQTSIKVSRANNINNKSQVSVCLQDQTNSSTPIKKKANANENNKKPADAADEKFLLRDEKVKVLEKNLMNYQKQRDQTNDELQKLQMVKTKTSVTMQKTRELENELSNLQNHISSIKNQLRELNALHPH